MHGPSEYRLPLLEKDETTVAGYLGMSVTVQVRLSSTITLRNLQCDSLRPMLSDSGIPLPLNIGLACTLAYDAKSLFTVF